MSPYRPIKIEIGNLLIEKGLIKPEQLEEALSVQRQRYNDKKLGQILIELGYISGDDLYFALAIQSGYPYIDIKRCIINKEAVSLIPEAIVKKFQVFPIDKIQEIITVAMLNPLDNVAIDQIKDVVKGNIKVFLTTASDLKEVVFRYYGRI